VDEVARVKTGKSKIVDRQREEEIVSRVRELATENNLDPAIVEKIYRLIIRGSVLRQRELISL
jgi:chorismate mutase